MRRNTCTTRTKTEVLSFQYSTTSRMRRNASYTSTDALTISLSVLNHESNEAKQRKYFRRGSDRHVFQYSTTSRMRRNRSSTAQCCCYAAVFQYSTTSRMRRNGSVNYAESHSPTIFQYSTTSRMRRNSSPTTSRLPRAGGFQYSTTSRMRRNVAMCASPRVTRALSVLNHESNEAKRIRL